MGIGKMRQRVDILETVNDAPDGFGGFTTTTTNVSAVWARVEETSGGRNQQTQTTVAGINYKVTMRTGAYNLTTDNLIGWEGKEIKIDSLTKDELKRYTIIEGWA